MHLIMFNLFLKENQTQMVLREASEQLEAVWDSRKEKIIKWLSKPIHPQMFLT